MAVKDEAEHSEHESQLDPNAKHYRAGGGERLNSVVFEQADERSTANMDEDVFEAKGCMQQNEGRSGMNNSAM
eukprot:12941616-Alexandrium_andersonii.AAC.1